MIFNCLILLHRRELNDLILPRLEQAGNGGGGLTLNEFDDVGVRGLSHILSVHLHDDVVLANSGPIGRAALPNRLHEDGLVAGQGEPVAVLVPAHDQGSRSLRARGPRRVGRRLFRRPGTLE